MLLHIVKDALLLCVTHEQVADWLLHEIKAEDGYQGSAQASQEQEEGQQQETQ